MDPMANRGRWLRPLAVAGSGLAVAALLFGVSLGTLLVVGVALLCPLLMLGMHGGPHSHGDAARSGRDFDGDDGPRAGG